ncbi:hypothetical protein ACLOJK_020668 [Asimina triloba]
MAADRVILFPFVAHGHLNPFAAFAQLLEKRTPFTVTIISTPLNIQKLSTSLPPNTAIQLIALPFDASEHGLPSHVQNTDALPHHLLTPFFHAAINQEAQFERLLIDLSQKDGRPPLCLIADWLFGWTVDVARRLGVFHALLFSGGSFGMAVYYSLWLHLPHRHTESECFSLRGFPETFRLHCSQLDPFIRIASEEIPLYALIRRQLSLSLGSDGILCNTVEGMETTGLRLLCRSLGLPVWSVGPLLPPHVLELPSLRNTAAAGKEGTISSWLNLHPQSSVIFVCFGSQYSISASQMMGLARGLEASGRPFVWLLRPPSGHSSTDDFRAEWLPEGFEERMRERKQGMLLYQWAPQLEILSHGSAGAFLSHCGWNSILEGLSHGLPIMGWPLMADQFFNAKMAVEELGVCLEVARGVEVEVSGEEVASVIEVVMGGSEGGREMRRRAMAARDMLRAAVKDGGSSVVAVEDFCRRISQSKMAGNGLHPKGAA